MTKISLTWVILNPLLIKFQGSPFFLWSRLSASDNFSFEFILYWNNIGFSNIGGEGDDRGWDGWMASLTQWTWVWVNSGSWWWTGSPGVLWLMGSQRVGHNWATELNWTLAYNIIYECFICATLYTVWLVLCAQSLSPVQLFVAPWTCPGSFVALQATLSMEFFWQEHWSGLPFPTPGDLTILWPRYGSCISCIGRQILYHLCHLGFNLFLKSRSFYAWQNPSIGSKAHFPFIFSFHPPPFPDVNPPQVSWMHSGNCLNTPLSTWYLTFSINCWTLLRNRDHLEILKPSFPFLTLFIIWRKIWFLPEEKPKFFLCFEVSFSKTL